MKKTVFTSMALMLISGALWAQDTLYFNKKWKPTTKQNASFFRPLPQLQKDSLYLIKDYYANGTLQMEGYSYTNTEQFKFEGKVTYYFPNGNIEIIRNYKNGKPNGENITYFKGGTLHAKGVYKNGRPYQGQFYRGGVVYNLNQGVKEGTERCCFNVNALNIEGMYKDGKPYNGKFFEPFNRKLTQYKNGIINGKQITYAEDMETIITQEEYNLGTIEGTFITTNKHTGETLTCIYKNGPYSGKEMVYDTEKHYINGKLNDEIEYDYSTGVAKVKTYYEEDEFGTQTLKKEFYKNGNTYILEYKNGGPHQGIEFHTYGFITYKNGSYNGPYEIVTNNYKETGTYKDFNKEGTITFVVKDSTYTCDYKNNKPYNGTDVNEVRGEIAQYQNGKRNGRYSKTKKASKHYDKIVGQFIKGIPTGVFKIYKNDIEVATATYKNGTPYQGVFYDNDNYKKYENGVLVFSYEEFGFKSHNITKQYDQNGVISQETVNDLRNNKSYHMQYKEGAPFSGEHFEAHKKSKYSIDNYTLTPYVNGVKEGLQSTYKYPFSSIIKTQTYKNNVLNGISTFYIDDKTYQCNYKNGHPIEGRYVTELKNMKQVFTVSDGKLTEVSHLVSYQNKVAGTGRYKNETPFEGYFVQFKNNRRIVEHYKNGIQNKTYIDGISNNLTAGKEIIVLPKTDSIYSSKFKVIVNYQTTRKRSGKATYFNLNEEELGDIHFKDNYITKVNVNFNLNDKENVFLSIEEDGVLYFMVSILDDLYAKLPLKRTINGPFAFFAANPISPKKLVGPKEITANYIHIKTKKHLGSITFKDGKPFEGLMIDKSYDSDGIKLKIKPYNNGKPGPTQRISLEEFLSKTN